MNCNFHANSHTSVKYQYEYYYYDQCKWNTTSTVANVDVHIKADTNNNRNIETTTNTDNIICIDIYASSNIRLIRIGNNHTTHSTTMNTILILRSISIFVLIFARVFFRFFLTLFFHSHINTNRSRIMNSSTDSNDICISIDIREILVSVLRKWGLVLVWEWVFVLVLV